MIMVDLPIAHADGRPPGEGRSHYATCESRPHVGSRHQTTDDQDQIQSDRQRHAGWRQVEQTFDHERLIELWIPAEWDGVAHEEMDVDDHEQVEHRPEHGDARLRHHRHEPGDHRPQCPHDGSSHVASSARRVRPTRPSMRLI